MAAYYVWEDDIIITTGDRASETAALMLQTIADQLVYKHYGIARRKQELFETLMDKVGRDAAYAFERWAEDVEKALTRMAVVAAPVLAAQEAVLGGPPEDVLEKQAVFGEALAALHKQAARWRRVE